MTSSIPQTMRAWSFSSRGEPVSVLKISSEHPTPSPSNLTPHQVLIKVSHISLNIGYTALIHLMPHWRNSVWIPELEFSGTIAALGARSITDLRPGDAVLGAQTLPMHLKYGGTLAEYIVIPNDLVVRKPENITFAEAAGLSGVGCTAVQLLELSGLQRGDKVLVNGGSGGLGTMVVQLAKVVVGESGLVVATCSEGNMEMVKNLGADEVIDYHAHSPLHEYLKEHHASSPFSAILDTVGSEDLHAHSAYYLGKKKPFLNTGGMTVALQPSLSGFLYFLWCQHRNRFLPTILGGIPRRFQFYSATPRNDTLVQVKQLAEEGKLKTIVDSIWEMDDALKAYERSRSQRARGKVVVHVQP